MLSVVNAEGNVEHEHKSIVNIIREKCLTLCMKFSLFFIADIILEWLGHITPFMRQK